MTIEEEFGGWADNLFSRLPSEDQQIMDAFISRMKQEYEIIKTISYKQGFLDGTEYNKAKSH